MSAFAQTLFSYLDAAVRKNSLRVTSLGGYAGSNGGTGAPVGGYSGYLPQGRAAFDTTEAETMYYPTAVISGIVVPSGASLVDNLNRIRYRIAQLETGAGATGLDIQESGIAVATDVSIINFIGAGVTVVTSGVTVTISGGGGGDSENIHNTWYGYNALENIDYDNGGEFNTAIGINSQFTNTVGGENVSVGEESLYSLTEGWDNIAIGYEALHETTEAYENIAIGSYSMYDNLEGSDNVAVRYNSLTDNTYGNNNVAIGYDSMPQNTEGFNNIGIGYGALHGNKEGIYNIGIGSSANVGTTYGRDNIGIGYNSLLYNGFGKYNVAIGSDALYNARTTYGYIYVISDYSGTVGGTVRATVTTTTTTGTVAGVRIAGTTTYDGTYTITFIDSTHFYFTHAFGATSSGAWAVEGKCDYNVAIGYTAGKTVYSGTLNTFIGTEAGHNALQKVDPTNSTAIGYGAYTTKDNQVVLGNTSVIETVLHGEMINPYYTTSGFLQNSTSGIITTHPYGASGSFTSQDGKTITWPTDSRQRDKISEGFAP